MKTLLLYLFVLSSLFDFLHANESSRRLRSHLNQAAHQASANANESDGESLPSTTARRRTRSNRSHATNSTSLSAGSDSEGSAINVDDVLASSDNEAEETRLTGSKRGRESTVDVFLNTSLKEGDDDFPFGKFTSNDHVRFPGTKSTRFSLKVQISSRRIDEVLGEINMLEFDLHSEFIHHVIKLSIEHRVPELLRHIEWLGKGQDLTPFYECILENCKTLKSSCGIDFLIFKDYRFNLPMILLDYVNDDQLINFEYLKLKLGEVKFRQVFQTAESQISGSFAHHARSLAMLNWLLRHGSQYYHHDMNYRNAIQELYHQKRYHLMNAFSFRDRAILYFQVASSAPNYGGTFALEIARENAAQETLEHISASGEMWCNSSFSINVKFSDAPLAEGNGVVRDWIGLILKSFFESENPVVKPLFIRHNEETTFYAPNPEYGPEVFKYAGSMIAYALTRWNIPVRVTFIPLIMKLLNDSRVSLADLKLQEPTIFQSYMSMKRADFDFETAEITFDDEESTPVTAANVDSYIAVEMNRLLNGNWSTAAQAFVEGFKAKTQNVIISTILSSEEFASMLEGRGKITAKKFLKGVTFDGLLPVYLRDAFIKCVTEMTEEQILKLIQYITNVRGLPFNGMKGFNPQIKIALRSPSLLDHLPEAATCFSTLRLHDSSSYEKFKQNMFYAIEHCDSALQLR